MRAGTKDTKPCLGDTMDDLHGKKARWEASGNTEEEEAMINPLGVTGEEILVMLHKRPKCSGGQNAQEA